MQKEMSLINRPKKTEREACRIQVYKKSNPTYFLLKEIPNRKHFGHWKNENVTKSIQSQIKFSNLFLQFLLIFKQSNCLHS